MTDAWEDTCRAFQDASAWFVATTAEVGDRWALPGLGEWDVRALVGHTSRSFVTVRTYLAQPAASAEVASAADYYRAVRTAAAGPEVVQRGRDAGRALGSDPAEAVADLAERVTGLVSSSDPGALVTTLAGGMRLSDYLVTRTFELTVHTADLAVALGLPPDVPATAARQALGLVAELAVAGGSAGTLMLAATGRLVPSARLTVL